jgi:o-succinylbenzoate synthase
MDLIQQLPKAFSLSFEKYVLPFKQASGTSRGILTEKKGWIFHLKDEETGIIGKGECSIIPGLSPDYTSDEAYEDKLQSVCNQAQFYLENSSALKDFSSILFGLESAYLDWKNGGKGVCFESPFIQKNTPIPINGLVWMGSESFMKDQIDAKLASGFSCIKMKVGAIDFETELQLLTSIRKRYSAQEIILRVDANGAFTPEEAMIKLERLAQLDIHSIEQPIKAGNWEAMAELCQQTPLPIALDEELIGINETKEKQLLLKTIQPQYIILKPSLHGGFSGSKEWIDLADEQQIPWWITSALESNIGLSAIAQFTGLFDVSIPQGLGTGGLFVSNFESEMHVNNGFLFHHS